MGSLWSRSGKPGRRTLSALGGGSASQPLAMPRAVSVRRYRRLCLLRLTVAVALGDKVEAGSCAIANSGSASGNTVTCNFGLTPEQLKQVTEAAVKGATEPLIDADRRHQQDAWRDRGRGQDAAEDRRRGREHSRRQAGRGAEQGRRRLQEIAGAGGGAEPGQSDGAKRSSMRPSRRSRPDISSAPTSCCVRRPRRRSPRRRRRASSRSRRRRPRTRRCLARRVRPPPRATSR